MKNALFPRPGRSSFRRPHNPDGFKTTTEMSDFVIEKYLSDAKPGKPFLLITRFIENVQVSCSIDHGEYADKLKTSYYLGRLSHETPIVTADKKAITIQIFGGFVTYPAPLRIPKAEEQEPPLRIPLYDFAHTPLKEPFKPPYALGYPALYDALPAFSFAVRLENVEKLVHEETKRNHDFSKWYIRAAKELGIFSSSHNTELRRIAQEWNLETLEELLEAHHDFDGGEPGTPRNRPAQLRRIRELLQRARDLQISWERREAVIGGIRYNAETLLEDLGKIYANKKE